MFLDKNLSLLPQHTRRKGLRFASLVYRMCV